MPDELITTTPAGPLSQQERERFAFLKNCINEHFKAFYEVGRAMAEIRDRRLYREHHETFEAFARNVYEVARSRAYQRRTVTFNGPTLPLEIIFTTRMFLRCW